MRKIKWKIKKKQKIDNDINNRNKIIVMIIMEKNWFKRKNKMKENMKQTQTKNWTKITKKTIKTAVE